MRRQALAGRATGIATLFCVVCAAAPAADTAVRLPPPTVEAGDLSDDIGRPADERVGVNEGTAVSDGPTVELITGGQSKDGAARVGRLPVLD